MQTTAADTGFADTEPHLTRVQETPAERWMIRAAVASGCLTALATAGSGVRNFVVTHHVASPLRAVAHAALILALTVGMQKRSFICASLLLIESIVSRGLLLPHQHGRFLAPTVGGLVVTSIILGLGVWATHTIDLRANRR